MCTFNRADREFGTSFYFDEFTVAEQAVQRVLKNRQYLIHVNNPDCESVTTLATASCSEDFSSVGYSGPLDRY